MSGFRLIGPVLVASSMGLLSSFGLAQTTTATATQEQVAAQSSSVPQSPDAAGPTAPGTLRWEPPVMDNRVYSHVLFNQLEGRSNGNGSALRWDGEAWVGSDMNRLWFKSEGLLKDSTMSDGDQEAMYDRPIPHTRYFDAQVGVREDLDSGPRRTWGAVGIEGLAPHFFEFEPTFYFRDGGHVAGRLEGSYDLLLTQRLIAQPEAELNFYSKADPGRGTGSGLSDLDAGVRIRYDVSRKFAPYIGFVYSGDYGGTAAYARQAGERVVSPTVVFGIRVWR